MSQVPEATFGLIGGSGTWGMRFPEDIEYPGVKVLEILPGFETPHGPTGPLKLLEIAGARVLRVPMHGCYPNDHEMIPPQIASKQVAWVFQQAGVKFALVDASVGGIQSLEGGPLPPWSAMVPDDFFMAWPSFPEPDERGRVQKPATNAFFRMASPFCPGLRQALVTHASNEDAFSVQEGGVYACTGWGRFETVTEIKALLNAGAHIVGQTVAHEAVAMRNTGIHFAAFNMVSNHAENGMDWIGDTSGAMADFYRECALPTARVMLDAMSDVITNGIQNCECMNFEVTGLGNFPVEGA